MRCRVSKLSSTYSPPPPGCRAGRRASKLVSLVASLFSAAYVRFWPTHFPGTPLAATPMFDGRAVLYPADATLRDYLSWRQADTHVNNLVGGARGPAGGLGAGGHPRELPARERRAPRHSS